MHLKFENLLRFYESEWKENNEIDLQAAGWKGMDWMDLAPDRDGWRILVNAVMNFRIPQNAGGFLD